MLPERVDIRLPGKADIRLPGKVDIRLSGKVDIRLPVSLPSCETHPSDVVCLQGFLAYKKTHLPRTLP